MICHSEFISESNDSNDLATLEIPKQVRDDNCDTVSSTSGRLDAGCWMFAKRLGGKHGGSMTLSGDKTTFFGVLSIGNLIYIHL